MNLHARPTLPKRSTPLTRGEGRNGIERKKNLILTYNMCQRHDGFMEIRVVKVGERTKQLSGVA